MKVLLCECSNVSVQNGFERGHGSGWAVDNVDVPALSFCFYRAEHFMGDRARKYDDQIRRTNAFHFAGVLGEHFCLTGICFTEIGILTFHTFVSANDNNTHRDLLFNS